MQLVTLLSNCSDGQIVAFVCRFDKIKCTFRRCTAISCHHVDHSSLHHLHNPNLWAFRATIERSNRHRYRSFQRKHSKLRDWKLVPGSRCAAVVIQFKMKMGKVEFSTQTATVDIMARNRDARGREGKYKCLISTLPSSYVITVSTAVNPATCRPKKGATPQKKKRGGGGGRGGVVEGELLANHAAAKMRKKRKTEKNTATGRGERRCGGVEVWRCLLLPSLSTACKNVAAWRHRCCKTPADMADRRDSTLEAILQF